MTMTMYNINKKSCRILGGLLFIAVLVYLLQSSTFMTQKASSEATQLSDWDASNNNRSTQIDIIQQQQPANEKAFVTFLCDDVMVCTSGTSTFRNVQTLFTSSLPCRARQPKCWSTRFSKPTHDTISLCWCWTM